MDKKTRFVVGGILTAIIIVMLALCFIYADVLFKNEIKITYPDGCVELFVNGELSTEECIMGRLLAEARDYNRPLIWETNITIGQAYQ